MISRNFLLGAALATALVVPSLASGLLADASGENSLATFAAARSQVEAQVLSSVQTLSAGLADWIAREAAKL